MQNRSTISAFRVRGWPMLPMLANVLANVLGANCVCIRHTFGAVCRIYTRIYEVLAINFNAIAKFVGFGYEMFVY